MSLLTDIVVGCIATMSHMLMAVVKMFLPKNPKSLYKKNILVTGAGRGLGRELSLQLADQGANVICIDIDENGLKETVEQVNSRYTNGKDMSRYYVVDVSDRSCVANLAEKLKQTGLSVDVLINNAGIVAATPLLEADDQFIEKILRVNLFSHFWMAKTFLPEMLRKNEGHIVAISSAAAFTCAKNIVPYSASKYGVTGFMANLREELRQNSDCDVHTTTVHPYFLDSKPVNVKHWEVNSRLPYLSIPEVARRTIEGIKNNEVVITIPGNLYFAMHLIWLLPQASMDYWRDIFYAKIEKK